jgi:hypothetical protein
MREGRRLKQFAYPVALFPAPQQVAVAVDRDA